MEKTTRSQIKIAVLGPESSGKTTMCKQLCKTLGAQWIPEFARQHLTNNPQYIQTDLDYFLRSQQLAESQNMASLLFCDGDPISFKVWSLFKYGSVSSFIKQEINLVNYDFYLLLKPDLPYEEDVLRENNSIENREKLFQLFENELIQKKLPYSIVEGLGQTRLNNALKFLQQVNLI